MEVKGEDCRCEEAVGSGNRGTFVACVCTWGGGPDDGDVGGSVLEDGVYHRGEALILE